MAPSWFLKSCDLYVHFICCHDIPLVDGDTSPLFKKRDERPVTSVLAFTRVLWCNIISFFLFWGDYKFCYNKGLCFLGIMHIAGEFSNSIKISVNTRIYQLFSVSLLLLLVVVSGIG